MSCHHQHDAAAFVLGALDAEELAGFEAHLRECAECRAEVDELGDLPTLLARAPVEDLDAEIPEPPASVLPNLVRQVNRDRRGRRLRAALVAAAAVVFFTVAGITVTVLWANSQQPSTVNASLKPVATVDIWGTADMREQKDGTLIKLECRHHASGSRKAPKHPWYQLAVTDSAGKTETVGSWLGDTDGTTHANLFTHWKPRDITVLEVRDMSGRALMRWRG